MRKLINLVVFVVFTLSCTARERLLSQEHFERATNLLEKKDYKGAIVLLKALPLEEGRAAAIYNNLGYAYYKSGEAGKALYYFEKGLSKAPFHKNLLNNRDFVVSQLSLNASNQETFWEGSFLKFYTDRILMCLMFFLVALTLWYLLVVLSIVKDPSETIKRRLKMAFTGSCIIVLCLICYLCYIHSVKRAIITNKNITARVGPHQQATKAFNLREGEKVTVLKQHQSWTKIRRYNGKIGWIYQL
jgi:tetratricopeptide (TPR) repeat protein